MRNANVRNYLNPSHRNEDSRYKIEPKSFEHSGNEWRFTTRAGSKEGQLFSQANINFTHNISLSNGNFYRNSLTFQPLGARLRSELRDINSQGGFFISLTLPVICFKIMKSKA